jgi:hypothetical protein
LDLSLNCQFGNAPDSNPKKVRQVFSHTHILSTILRLPSRMVPEISRINSMRKIMFCSLCLIVGKTCPRNLKSVHTTTLLYNKCTPLLVSYYSQFSSNSNAVHKIIISPVNPSSNYIILAKSSLTKQRMPFGLRFQTKKTYLMGTVYSIIYGFYNIHDPSKGNCTKSMFVNSNSSYLFFI